jgi:quercetin dioxygenase-like cupin family protein
MTENFTFFQDLASEIKEIQSESILSRNLLKAGRVQATLFGFAPGQELTEHTSAYPAIIHILQGEADITLGDQKKSVQAGSWAYMEPNLPHSLAAHTPVTMLLLLMVG